MKDYDDRVLADLIPYPKDDANKYTRGKLTLIVGSRTYPGAAVLAACASQRAGAGYSEVFADEKAVNHIRAARPSLVVRSWSAWDATAIEPSTSHHPRAYVIGCGFDAKDDSVTDMIRRVLRFTEAPVLVDGGALKHLSAKKMHNLSKRRSEKGLPTIVTPHMGEAKVLAEPFGLDTSDPKNLALELARSYGAIVVLKGPDTFISDGMDVYRMTAGTAALAKAGTGDVLAGIIGAFLAQGIEPVDACVLGATLHAKAGALAALDYSPVSVCAEDVIDYLPKAILAMRSVKAEPSAQDGAFADVPHGDSRG